MEDYNKNIIIELPLTYDDVQTLKHIIGRSEGSITEAEMRAGIVKLLADCKEGVENG